MGKNLKRTLGADELELNRLIENRGLDIFTVNDVLQLVEGSEKETYNQLEKLARSGQLHRLEKGKYCRHNFRDEKVIGSFLVKDGAIAYWSAMQHHGKTEQLSDIMYIQTTSRKKELKVFGVTYVFITVRPYKMIGILKEGFGNHQYRVTDREKTLVDCFDQPKYAGAYGDLVDSLNHFRDLDTKKLIEYCKAIRNTAATKRLGYWLNQLSHPGAKLFKEFAQNNISSTFSLLDPTGIKKGRYSREWYLQLNVDPIMY